MPRTPESLPTQCLLPDAQAGEQLLAFDADRSMLQIYAYRDGRLGRLGHNHVISSSELWGYVRLAGSIRESGFALCLPVDTLVVDDPGLRAAAGEQFDNPLSEAAVAGTRRNMLSEKLLDQRAHPYLVIEGRGLQQTDNTVSIQLSITVKGRTHRQNSSAEISLDSNGIQVSGMMKIRQTDLGLEPYSALFGTLKVRDELEIRYLLHTR